ncbi:(S)-mandelate dehydrogenase [compost metagenome]
MLKALALGAQAVLIGRATLYGTAAAGEAGAARAIAILREETDRVMALLGARDVASLNREVLQIEAAASREDGYGAAAETALHASEALTRAV